MFIETVILLLSSLITFGLGYLQVPTRNLQQIIAVLVVIMLVFLVRYPSLHLNPAGLGWMRKELLFLSSLFVQILVVSTGGFYSPFLIMVHLYALGTSFLLNLGPSLSFLVFTILILISNIFLNESMYQFFQEDPWSVALYLISFVVIVPIAQILLRSYRIKDTLSEMLSSYIKIEEQKGESILSGLRELVIVTDKNLKILTINHAAEVALDTSNPQVLGHSIFEVINLKDKSGNRANSNTLSINEALKDQAARIVQGFQYSSKNQSKTSIVDIQVRPIFDAAGKINQVVFVINESVKTGASLQSKQESLKQAHLKQQAIVKDLMQSFSPNVTNRAKFELEMLTHLDEDLMTYVELGAYPIKEQLSHINVAKLCQQILTTKVDFAQKMGVNLQFSLQEGDSAERALIGLEESNLPSENLPVSKFSTMVDPTWLKVLVDKMLEIAILITSGEASPTVNLSILQGEASDINIQVISNYSKMTNTQQPEIFIEYYGSLNSITNLRYGSGLEGAIAKNIAEQLHFPLVSESSKFPPQLILTLKIASTTFK